MGYVSISGASMVIYMTSIRKNIQSIWKVQEQEWLSSATDISIDPFLVYMFISFMMKLKSTGLFAADFCLIT